jgi:3-deoxy-7-phosphoheptulonate synthase
MLIVMRASATEEQTSAVKEYVTSRGFTIDVIETDERTMIGVLQDVTPLRGLPIDSLSGVERVVSITHPFKLASRDFRPVDTVVKSAGLAIGGHGIALIGHVTSIPQDHAYLASVGSALKRLGFSALRVDWDDCMYGGLSDFERRSLTNVREKTGLPILAEVISSEQVELVEAYAAVLLVGAQSMYGSALISRVGQSRKPVVLERGLSATIEEWLLAANSIIAEGNLNVILCEHGIRAFETREILDVNAVPALKQLSHLPVVVDCGQAAPNKQSACGIAKAGIAAGADGLVVDVYDASRTTQQRQQQLSIDDLRELVPVLGKLAAAMGRKLSPI